MNLRTSYFNKSIIRSDFKRFWWVSALHTLAIFLFATFIFLERNYGMEKTFFSTEDYLFFYRSSLYYNSTAYFVFALSFPAVLATFLFSYLHTGNASSCLHGIPVSRNTHYISHTFCGIVLFTLPILINAVILLIFRFDAGIQNSYRLLHLFQLCAVTWIYSLICFSMASLLNILTGHAVAGLLFGYFVAAIPALLEAFTMEFLQRHLFGFCYDYSLILTQKLYLPPMELIRPEKWFFYLILSIVIWMLGLILYRLRKLENHSEVLAFPKLRPVFVYIVALFFGGIGYLYLSELFSVDNILFLIPFGLLGILIAEMLMQKSLRVKKVYKPMLVFICAGVCLFVTLRFDLTGYERRVPQVSDIESAVLQPLYLRNFDHHSYGYSLSAKNVRFDDDSRTLTEEEQLEHLTALHKNLTVTKPTEDDNNNDYYSQFILYYHLKNGRTLKREYYVPYSQNSENLKPLLETEQLRKSYFPILSPAKIPGTKLLSISIEDNRLQKQEFCAFYENESEIMQRITDALKKDLLSVPAETFLNQWDGLTQIILTESVPQEEDTKTENIRLLNLPTDPGTKTYHYTYEIRPGYHNTIALLTEFGLYNALPKAEQITKIGVEYFGEHIAPPTEIIDANKIAYSFHNLITDPQAIAEIYQNLEHASPLAKADCSLQFFTDTHTFRVSVNRSDSVFGKFLQQP